MSPASRSKSRDKKAGKETQPKGSPKPSGHATSCSVAPVSGYNPLLGKFHALEMPPLSSAPPLHINSRFQNIDETDDHSGNSLGTGIEYDTVSNNDSWSGESEDHKEKTSNHLPLPQESIPGADNDKREKIRQKNEKKHQRQREKRALELHERCSGFLMSRKLEGLAQQLVAMGFSSERATMALILNEGKIEQSVVWLLEGGEEEVDKHEEHNNLDGGNLKIDISEELARIADLEIRYKCSKQDVERAIVACEGDLEKAADTLRMHKEDPPSPPPKPEETDDPPTVSNGRLSIPSYQNSLKAQQKPNPSSTTIQQRRDEKDFNYTKTSVTIGLSIETGGKNVQALRKVQPKLDGAKPNQISVPSDKRWPPAVSNPSVSYSLASSPLQATPPIAKTETRYLALGGDLKNLQLGSVKEPVVVMQRPQSANVKQSPTTSISSSPPLVKSNGLSPHITSTRNLAPPSNSNSNQLYNQLQYQHHLQFVSNGGMVDSTGTSRGNGLWNKMGTSPTISAASSLGLFSGLGSNGSSGSSPVDWNNSGSMLQLDYANIDWTLDRRSSMSRSSGMWKGMTSSMQNTHTYDPYNTSRPNTGNSSRPGLANGGGVPLAGLQDGVALAEMSGSREWSSPFEEKDLFSLPRQFVSSPSL
ncbi:hypothetical protein U1Q18_025349 [Sarracenia purpurea var. burkii]